jgi:branched-chain amino acid aminotransferase
VSNGRYAFFKGAIVPMEEARISVSTHSFNYGTGVFEGLRAYWNEDDSELFVFRMKEHFERLIQNTRMLMIDVPYSADELCDITLDLLQKEGFQADTYIRPIGYKSKEQIGAIRLHDIESDFTMFCTVLNNYIDTPKGCHAGVASWRRLDDTMLPPRTKATGAYVNTALAKTEAMLNGFDEAIVLNSDGHVAEGSAANLMMVRHGKLVTSPKSANILEGITRATMLDLAKDHLDIEVEERQIDRTELYAAEELFFCGTGVEVVGVAKVDHRTIGIGETGPITLKLRDLYFQTVRGQLPEYRDWCTPVYQTVTTG